MKRTRLSACVLLLSLSLPVLGSAATPWWKWGASPTNAPAAEAEKSAPASLGEAKPETAPAPGGGPAMVTSFAPIVKKVAPSVVTVFTTKKVKEQDVRNPFMGDPFFQRFFGNMPGMPGNGNGGGAPAKPRFQEQQGLGSGVIVSADGYILTNVHVVDVADEIKVRIGNEKKDYAAKVIGKDPLSDIALIKITATGLTAIPLADSSKVEVGDVVLALGNPFALGQTVTMGIVSALDRTPDELGAGTLDQFIQTDAAINPGNSGGPLVDTAGRMIGINSAIYTRSGGNMGIGFAIPSNMARHVMESLLKQGRVIRGFLGVSANALTPDLVKKFSLPDDNGVLVAQVESKSAAEAAGVQVGDVITEFNGKKISDYHDLRTAVTETAPGKKVRLALIRNGHPKTLDVTLKEMPAAASKPEADDAAQDEPAEPATEKLLPGVQIADLNDAGRHQFDAIQYPADLKGALVVDVQQDSPAAKPGAAGLQPGDVILEVEHKEVHSAKEAVLAAHKAKGGLLLRVWTRGNPRYLVIQNSDQ
ncbi:MAG: Do family serine endopeptidase [Verrucomicrobium sp.]|nr:Do family serine endopeptidase [Verrucomicrobium sp.]